MGHRLSKIYTRTGDKGETGLGDGSRVAKDNLRIEAIGAIDELNSVLGVLLSKCPPPKAHDILIEIQHKLFDLGGELAIPGHSMIESDDVEYLEARLNELNADLPPLKEFILPGGCERAAYCHLARSVARRAERRLISLAREQTVNPVCIQYTNRLSDLLFVMARSLNRIEHHKDVLWRRD